MALSDFDLSKAKTLGPEKDGTYKNAMGGTELMNAALYERVDGSLLEQFNIIKSRVRHIDSEKKNVLWCHDLWNDPESKHLSDPELRKRFSKIVFVSNWQQTTYNMGLGVPYSQSYVMKNAIEPIPSHEKPDPKERVNLIYHTTPHRGLDILVSSFSEIAKVLGDSVDIHLDVYSSFEAYGWKERDKPYEVVFDTIKNHPKMTYHGYKPNDVVRKALTQAHIFAYPNIWQETSCIAAIEAMSAGCEIVCPNLAALPETTGGWATMYQFSENNHDHVNVFANVLYSKILNFSSMNTEIENKLQHQKNWADYTYNWDRRAAEWTDLLRSL